MADFDTHSINVDTDFDGKDISSINSTTVIGQAEWMKSQFDSSVKQVVVPKYNGLIQSLKDIGAASQIGAAPLLPGGAATVGGQLSYLKDELNGIALSQIPDGTVTDAKLSDEAGQVKARLLAVEQEKAPLISPAFAGEPSAPTADVGDNSEKLANTAYVQGELQSVSTHIGNTDIHVTADKKTAWDGHLANADIHVTAALNQKLAGFEPLKLLWSGTWESGSISVPGFQNYQYLVFETNAYAAPMLIANYTTWAKGGGNTISGGGEVITNHISFSASGDTLTLDQCVMIIHTASSSHSAKSNDKVRRIYGLA